jgi:YHS domain-containing protein
MEMIMTITTSAFDGYFLKMFFLLAAVLAIFGSARAQQYNGKYLNNVDAAGVILQGYDAVSYFSDNKPVKGDPKYSAQYNDATYWFSSEEHANMFKERPGMFAPQYGDFCGYAMSLNKLRPVDPAIFQIVDGRLIFQHTPDAFIQFNKDIHGNISKADTNWPGQVAKHLGKKIKFDKPAQSALQDGAGVRN